MNIQKLWDSEMQLVKALPALAKKAHAAELEEILVTHAEETRDHAERLEKICKALEIKIQKIPGQAIRGLIADAERAIKNMKDSQTQDAIIISVMRGIEHYEIAEYTSLTEWAILLKETSTADLLSETLGEEAETEEALGDLAETINKITSEHNSNDAEEDEDEEEDE